MHGGKHDVLCGHACKSIGTAALPMNPTKASNMKSFAAILALLLVAVGAANAGDIIIKPKDSDGSVVGVAYQKKGDYDRAIKDFDDSTPSLKSSCCRSLPITPFICRRRSTIAVSLQPMELTRPILILTKTNWRTSSSLMTAAPIRKRPYTMRPLSLRRRRRASRVGTMGRPPPAIANAFDSHGAGLAHAAPEQIGGDQFMFGKSIGRETTGDFKLDMTGVDHATVVEIQHLLDVAHDTSAASPLDPHYGTVPQDMAKTHHLDQFHFV